MLRPSHRPGPAALVGLLLVATVAPAADGPSAPIDFVRDVRPILADKCFACHGPDESKREAGLRLDIAEGATAVLESGSRAIVPGQPDDSDLVFRITAEEAELKMPPETSGKTLKPSEIETLRAWVEQGGEYKVHWAFVPPRRPALPAVGDPSWCANPIDFFVLARLEAEGLAPSPEADRTTLIRRLSLDLTGLPPTPEEVDAFVADASPEAMKDLVDRLLASPRYGERWARPWLDAARYADSDGYEKDKQRQVWFFRDWVVNALNRDLPYDQFIIDQLAGDERPDATQDQVVATGFLRNSMINEEGGVDPEQFRMEAMFDRMDAVGKSVLGLTIQCAQCHTHKYDPLTQEEYYRVFAFLNNTHEANVAVYTPREQRERSEIFREIAAIEDDLKHKAPDWADRLASWEETVRGDQPDWRVVRPELDSSGGQKHYLRDDGSILAAGYAPTKHTTEFTAKTDLAKITAVRLELLNDPNLPLGGPGRSTKGLFGLTEFKVVAKPAGGGEAKEVKVAVATSDVNPAEAPLEPIFDDKSGKRRVTGPIAYAIDGKDETAWGIDIGPGRRNVPRKAVFVLESPVEFPDGAELTFKLVQNHGGWNSDDNQNMNLGSFRFAVTDRGNAQADPLPAAVREALAIPKDRRTAAQAAAVFSHWRMTVPEWKEANERIEALWKEHPEGASQLVLDDREELRPTHLLMRGDFLKPDRPVGAGVPAFLNPLPADAPPTRMTFARWLVDRQAPTTARAIVNRIWQGYFGTGLVGTPEDFGVQGEAPSHPELLDWLAVELMDSGWSLKHIHRRIVGSATYRQSSKVTPDRLAKDPANRLLSRGPRFRVDAEIVRDIALAASGLLNPAVGGPSVYPPAPDFLFQPPASYGPKVWKESTGADRYRRALYTFRYRSVPYPALQNFDAPNGDFACVRRTRSNTPLQALTTLNEPLFLECARALAAKTLREGGATDEDRLTFAFRRCLSRRPTEAESQTLLALLHRETDRFAVPEAKPWDLAAEKPEEPPALPDGITPAQAASWTVVSRVLLNLDETITKE
jgi:hypothetical protein